MAWQDFEHESTEDLIEYIRMLDDPDMQEASRDAFRAFCFRFGDDVRKTCRVVCRQHKLDDSLADVIAEKTFKRFQKYPRYKPEKCKSGDPDDCVTLYLYGIAQTVLIDHLNGLTKPFTGEEEIVTDFPDVEAMDIPEERKAFIRQQFELVKQALARLSSKHLPIYLTYKLYEKELSDGHYLPRQLLKKMQDGLQLSQATIRAYKIEAFKEVEEFLKIYGTK
jgi:DNA-directed RNA polymerase specialized sigma24 family protein